MKLTLFFFLLLPSSINAQDFISQMPIVDNKVQFETIITVKDVEANKLYSDIKLIIADMYKSGKAVIDIEDNEAMYIIINGITYYPLKDWLGTVNQRLEHTFKFQFKNERIRITFSNLVVSTVPLECIIRNCRGYKYPQKIRQTHAKEVIKTWERLIENITTSLEESNDDW